MNTLADGWQIAQKHLAGQHDQEAHGRRAGGKMGLPEKPDMKQYISSVL